MHVAVAKLDLHLPGNRDLKGKRRVLKSLCARVRNRFDVAIAEVGDNDLLQSAAIGIAAVSNSQRHAAQSIDNAIAHVESTQGDYQVLTIHTEILSGF